VLLLNLKPLLALVLRVITFHICQQMDKSQNIKIINIQMFKARLLDWLPQYVVPKVDESGEINGLEFSRHRGMITNH